VKRTLDQGDLVPVQGGGGHRGDRSIGTILIHAGRISLEDAELIMRTQRERGLRFGDAAIELGLLTQADVQFALSRQFDYPYLVRGESNVSEHVISAYAPLSPQAQVISAVRSQLMLRWFDNEVAGKALAIISAERGEGRSFVVANLAVAFSQLGQNTLLIDADMRNPSQHMLFGLENRNGLSAVLSNREEPDKVIQRIPDLPNLSVLPTGAVPPNPLELLARPLFPQLLQELVEEYQIILIDSPNATETADAQTIAVRAGAALIVVRKNASRMWQVRGVSDTVAQASTNIVGTVLNDF